MGRDLQVEKFEGEKNALSRNPHPISAWRMNFNMFLVTIARRLPYQLKNRLIKWMGVDLGENVYICYAAWFDIICPEKISVDDNTTVGGGVKIIAHEATQDEYRTGEVKIGENVLIGTQSIILPGVEIGDNAEIAAGSLVNRDVEEGEFVGGVPIETIEEGKSS
jgi:maltose O-acetyltransferase